MFLVLILVNSLLLWSSSVRPVDCEDEVGKVNRLFENELKLRRDKFIDLNKCLDSLDQKLKEREELIKKMKVRIDKIWVTDKHQHIKTKIIVKGNVHVLKELTVTNKVILTKPIKSVDPVGTEKRYGRASREVNELVEMVNHKVVRKDRAEQVINGTIHFLHPVRANYMQIASIRPSTLINNISIHELQTNVLRKSGNQVVTGNWKMDNLHVHVGNLTVKGLVNMVNMSDALLTNSTEEQVVTGHLKIRNGTFKTLRFDSINGIKRKELVLKSHYSPKIVGSKTFKKVESTEGITVTGHLNGYNWTHLINNSINIDSPTSIPIPASLRFATVPKINKLTTRYVNNMRIDNLKAGLTPEELVELSGRKTFRSLSASKVTLYGKLNGLSIQNDLVPLRSLQTLQQPITFEGRITFNSNLTVGTINEVNITRDAVRRWSPTPQIIHGTKVFDRPVHVRNLRAKESRLRHINLDNLDPNAQDGSQFARRSNVVYEDQLTIKGSLTVKRINGIDIDKLMASLFSRSRDQVISWPTKFNGSLSVNSATTNTINNLSVPRDLVRINSNGVEQVITGRKVFETVTLGTNSELKMIGHILNGKNLESMGIIKNDPSKRKDCYGHKRFSSVKVMGNIIAEKVNGLNLERDVMLVNRPQNISSKLIFNADVRAYQLSFPDGVHVGTINNVPVDDALDGLVLHDAQSVTLENKDFHGGLVADEINLLGTINGVNLLKLGSSVVSLDTPQAIYSPLKFEDEVTFDNPIDTRSVNGQDLQREFATLLNQKSASPGGIKIIGNVRIDGDVITERLNGRPADMYKDMIIQKQDNRFDRPVIFDSNVTIEHLTVSNEATLDGIFPSELIQLDRAIHLDQPIRIRGNARIDHQLIVRTGNINNCSLDEITSLTEYRNRSSPIHLHRPIDFNQVNILGNLRLINGTINNVNVDQLGAQAQIIASRDQSFNSNFTFEDDIHVDELFIEGPINGVNLRAIYADSVRQSAGYQRITGHKTFKSLRVNNGEVTFKGNVNLRGTINGINVTKLYNDLIRPGEFNVVRGVKIFTSSQPVVLHNIESPSISGVNLSDLALTSSSETINSDTSFMNSVEIDKLETRRHHGRQLNKQQSSVQFMNPVNVQRLNVKRINGIPIENFVSTLRDAQLNGSYSINQIYIHGDLMMDPNSTINGVDLSAIRNQSVDIRSSNFIPGVIILDGGAHFEQGIDVSNDSTNGPEAVKRYQRSLINATNALEMDLRQVENALKSQTMRLAQAAATIDMDEKEFDAFDIIDYFNDFDIATDHIKSISISTDYRPTNVSRPMYNQGLTRSVYLGYDQPNKCDQLTSVFDIRSAGKQTTLQDRAINENGKHFAPITFALRDGTWVSVSGWTNLPDCGFSATFGPKFRSSITFDYQYSNFTINFDPENAFSAVKYFLDNDRIVFITLRSIQAGEQSSSTIKVHDCSPINRDGLNCPLTHYLKVTNAISMEFSDSKVLRNKFVAIMTHPRAECPFKDPKIFIFSWNPLHRRFYQSGSISAPNPVTMKFIEYPQRNFSTLIIASNRETGICAHDANIPSSTVGIFLLEISGLKVNLKLQQSIDLNTNAISSFSVGQSAYLVLASKSDETTHIYRLERNNKFESHQEHTTKGVEDVKCFWSSPDQLLMVTSTTDHHKAVLYQAIFT